MKKSRLIVISSISASVALVCLLVAGFIKWFAVIVAVVASVAVTIPLLLSPKNLKYSIFSYLSSVILGVILGGLFANIGYVLLISLFAMPVAIVKCYGENNKNDYKETTDTTSDVTDKSNIETAFDFDDDNSVKVNTELATYSPKIPALWRWIIYFVCCEVAIVLSTLGMYLLMPDVIAELVRSKVFYIAIAVLNLIVPFYNYFLNGVFALTKKTLAKAHLL